MLFSDRVQTMPYYKIYHELISMYESGKKRTFKKEKENSNGLFTRYAQLRTVRWYCGLLSLNYITLHIVHYLQSIHLLCQLSNIVLCIVYNYHSHCYLATY